MSKDGFIKQSEDPRSCMSCGSKKRPIAPRALVFLLVISVIAAFILSSCGKQDGGSQQQPGQTVSNDDSPASTEPGQVGSNDANTAQTPAQTPALPGKSSIVSKGVPESELGNIVNHQFYFATDEYIFYTNYDVHDRPHIYSMKPDGTDPKIIFDGFGWSFVVIDNWLYFIGNQGETLDYSYNVFRISFDGSQIEKIIDHFAEGMSRYDNYLYYMRQNEDYSHSRDLCRSDLNGNNEEVIFHFANEPLLYKDKLYYHDNSGNTLRYEPDGTDPEVILGGADVDDAYVLSGEKIIYKDYYNTLYACDLNGNNHEVIRESDGMPIDSLNAYKGIVFFAEYDPQYNRTLNGFNFTVKSCNLDGSDEKTVFTSTSADIYINIVNDKLMILDFAQSPTPVQSWTDPLIYIMTLKVMNLDGSGMEILPR